MADEKTKKPTDGLSTGLAFERPLLEMEAKITELKTLASTTHLDLTGEIRALEERLSTQTKQIYGSLSPWERVNVARHAERPLTTDYINAFDDFVELHGDRKFGDDHAIVTGLATLRGRSFLCVGHRKGKTVKERLACNFGCAHPEGYRKALQKMKLAERMGLPIVCFVNTPGAYPGIGAEERGQASAIATNILEMFQLRVPVIVVVVGEGGSGGALGIGIGDRVAMLEHSYYSVISPEGCAAILWKAGDRAPDAAEALSLTSDRLSELGLVDAVIEEPLGGAHRDAQTTIERVNDRICQWLDELAEIAVDDLLSQRHDKFRNMGVPVSSGS